jgi:hypothetical protein
MVMLFDLAEYDKILTKVATLPAGCRIHRAVVYNLLLTNLALIKGKQK